MAESDRIFFDGASLLDDDGEVNEDAVADVYATIQSELLGEPRDGEAIEGG